MKELLLWDMYEVRATKAPIIGVKFRGRVRKYCLEHGRNVLVENAQDMPGTVRFAVPVGEDVTDIVAYIETLASGVQVSLLYTHISNPVLSKIQVNKEEKYTV